MHIAFSRVIKVGDRNLEFNFRKLPAVQSSYYVDVTDEKGERISFSIFKSKEDNVWRTAGNRMPLWIGSFDHSLGQVIEEEESILNSQDPEEFRRHSSNPG